MYAMHFLRFAAKQANLKSVKLSFSVCLAEYPSPQYKQSFLRHSTYKYTESWARSYKTFYGSNLLKRNKLECFFLPSLFSLA
jgi:hypothetical protein